MLFQSVLRMFAIDFYLKTPALSSLARRTWPLRVSFSHPVGNVSLVTIRTNWMFIKLDEQIYVKNISCTLAQCIHAKLMFPWFLCLLVQWMPAQDFLCTCWLAGNLLLLPWMDAEWLKLTFSCPAHLLDWLLLPLRCPVHLLTLQLCLPTKNIPGPSICLEYLADINSLLSHH